MTNLTKQTTESEKMLPKKAAQRASLCQQFVRCGRPGCRCASGAPETLHGPYFYWFWREHGRLRKEYVPKAWIPEVQDIFDQRRQARERQRQEYEQSLAYWRLLRSEIKEAEHSNCVRLDSSGVPLTNEPR